MHISGEFVKQDIDPTKQYIENGKQDIGAVSVRLRAAGFTPKTVNNTNKLFEAYGFDAVFGRSEVISTLNVTPSPASTLLKKLMDSEIIEPVTGMGKGKYRFRR